MQEFADKIRGIVTPRTAPREISGIKFLSPEEMEALFEESTMRDFGMTGDEFRAAHAAGTFPDKFDPNIHHDAILGGISPVQPGIASPSER